MSRNEALTLELPAELVDMLADFARADGETMRLASAVAQGGGIGRFAEVERERKTLADAFALRLLHVLPTFSAEGDLADALNERAEVYDDYRRSQVPATN